MKMDKLWALCIISVCLLVYAPKEFQIEVWPWSPRSRTLDAPSIVCVKVVQKEDRPRTSELADQEDLGANEEAT